MPSLPTLHLLPYPVDRKHWRKPQAVTDGSLGAPGQDAMLFCSESFLLFYVSVFAVYWALRWDRARVWLLLVASFGFYATWNRWLACLICGTTLLDWLVGLALDATTNQRRRRLLLAASLTANLGLLCYFKYANFFLRSLEDLLHHFGATASFPVLSVLLPVGISFYTFEAISYTVDVYQRRLRAERSLPNFMLFILFFPHLIAGPIVRARDFLPQVRRHKRWDWARARLGMQLFLLGLVKKLAIADRMAMYADPVFKDPTLYNPGTLWLANLAWMLQVYCDFSGYSDMALGTAHLLGYRLTKNFDMPFLAVNISEFWRRWHMSLSNWLRDYVFFPLGGSRHGEVRTALNLIAVMALCGLWHGAAWPFIVFGVLQGLCLIAHRHFRRLVRRWPRVSDLLETGPGTALRVLLTVGCFFLSLVIFRSPTLAAGGRALHIMLLGRHHPALGAPNPDTAVWLGVILVVLGHTLGFRGLWRRLAEHTPIPIRGLGYALLLSLALVLAPQTQQAFVYFQF